LSAHDQMILTLTENGFGKRTSAYEYRLTRRGGQGIRAIDMTERNGPIVASFPIEDGDQIVAVTNGGQMIRVPVDDIRIAGRATQGVWVFRPGEDERVVSAVAVGDLSNGDNGDHDENGGDEADADEGEPTED
jgi:DNA gyrase subunit A